MVSTSFLIPRCHRVDVGGPWFSHRLGVERPARAGGRQLPSRRPLRRIQSKVHYCRIRALAHPLTAPSHSGRLPYTIGKSVTDYAAQVTYTGSGIVPIPYNEGLFIDYRHFDQVSALPGRVQGVYSCSHVKASIAPRFEFGFGLSYTTFDYSGLKISGSTAGGTRQPIGPGASLDPW